MHTSRRTFINHSAYGIFGFFSLKNNPTILNQNPQGLSFTTNNEVHSLYPSTDPDDIKSVVGASHSNLQEVKKLISARPELAKATYDWGFGDVESAIGAASHMGREDIATFLIEHGARPNIFTYAMLGKINAVKAMINDIPGIEKTKGPHGFTLMHHAQIRLKRNNVEGIAKKQQEALVSYLESLEDTDIRDTSLNISEEEQQNYYGIYKFGEGENEYFEVKQNSRGMLFISRAEYTGRALNRVGQHIFAPVGAPSVKIVFAVDKDIVNSFTIHDPEPILNAVRT